MISNDPLRSGGTLKFQLLDDFCGSTSVMRLRVTHISTCCLVGYLVTMTMISVWNVSRHKLQLLIVCSRQLVRLPARKRKNRRSLSIPSQLHTLGFDQHCMYVPLRGLMSIVNQAADKSVDGAYRQPCQSYCPAWGFPQQPLPPHHPSFLQEPIPPPHHLSQLQTS